MDGAPARSELAAARTLWPLGVVRLPDPPTLDFYIFFSTYYVVPWLVITDGYAAETTKFRGFRTISPEHRNSVWCYFGLNHTKYGRNSGDSGVSHRNTETGIHNQELGPMLVPRGSLLYQS